MVFFTADMHFGHRAIINMQSRPFESVEEIRIPRYKSELTYVKREAEESLPRKKTARSNWP